LTKRIFITATNTDVGKTYATKRLMQAFSAMGYRVGVCKPIETGVTDVPHDGTELLELAQLLNPLMQPLCVDDIVPIQFALPASPYVANHDERIDVEKIESTIKKIEKNCDILLIEGAGGLFVPLDRELMMIDLIPRLYARALLVSHCRLGCINDTLLSHYALIERGIDHVWTLNCRKEDNDFFTVSEPYFKDNFPEYTLLERDIDRVASSLLALFEQ
jgi:dethiobiotin synthetase